MKLLLFLSGRLVRVFASLRTLVILRGYDISAGSQCFASSSARLRATDGGRLALGSGVEFDRFSDVTVKYGIIKIGSGSYIGQGAVICARESISIGENCLIAERVTIRDQDHRFGEGVVTAKGGFLTSPVCIGNNVWIGANCTITKGVTVGDNAVIGANSVVTRDVPANAVFAGVPAMPIRQHGCDGVPDAPDADL